MGRVCSDCARFGPCVCIGNVVKNSFPGRLDLPCGKFIGRYKEYTIEEVAKKQDDIIVTSYQISTKVDKQEERIKELELDNKHCKYAFGVLAAIVVISLFVQFGVF